MKGHAIQLAFGVAFGFVFSRGGFSDWRELNGMFRLQSWDPAIAFATVVAVTAPIWLWLKRYATRPYARPVHPGSVPGGLLFGVGWALSGACPTLALVQLGAPACVPVGLSTADIVKVATAFGRPGPVTCEILETARPFIQR